MCHCLEKFFLLAVCICIQVSLEANGEDLVVGSLSMAESDLVEADFVYYKDFFFQKSDNFISAEGCSLVKRKKSHRRVLADVSVLHCKEQINVLLPRRKISPVRLTEKKQGYILLNFPLHGVNPIKVQLAAVKPAALNKFSDAGFSDIRFSDVRYEQSSPVTATSVRHVSKVNVWQFKNSKTRVVTTINATPEHRFYVKNRQSYRPLESISTDDQLITADGRSVHLVCPLGRRTHCGGWYAKKTPVVPVYNMEVYQQHVYFAGRASVLVHNVCDEELRKILPGKDGHSSAVASLELKKMKVHTQMLEEGKGIRVYSDYPYKETFPATSFSVEFFPDKWIFTNEFISEDRAFLPNDVTRMQYLKARKTITERAETGDRFIDISHPKELIWNGINTRDGDLHSVDFTYSETGSYNGMKKGKVPIRWTPGYTHYFWKKGHGTLILPVLGDFGFKKTGMGFKYDAANDVTFTDSISIKIAGP